jgi:O-acetyl-ADP-ribose deacetylase (regulator of RNase III)
MSYKEVRGNIFNSKVSALVNTVNCVGVMGKGIALEFRLRYPKMFKEYQQVCERGELKPGQIFPYPERETWILNFAIKNDWKQPSKIEWIENCLKEFPKIYQDIGIKSVAFPWMGAMNGGIPVEKIKEITRKYLSNLTDIDIEVYDFDPDASDPLFEKLNDIAKMQSLDVEKLSKRSEIQHSYMEKIIKTIKEKNIKSLPRFVETGVIGKTNIEKLYSFLMDPKTDSKNFYSKTKSQNLSLWAQ